MSSTDTPHSRALGLAVSMCNRLNAELLARQIADPFYAPQNKTLYVPGSHGPVGSKEVGAFESVPSDKQMGDAICSFNGSQWVPDALSQLEYLLVINAGTRSALGSPPGWRALVTLPYFFEVLKGEHSTDGYVQSPGLVDLIDPETLESVTAETIDAIVTPPGFWTSIGFPEDSKFMKGQIPFNPNQHVGPITYPEIGGELMMMQAGAATEPLAFPSSYPMTFLYYLAVNDCYADSSTESNLFNTVLTQPVDEHVPGPMSQSTEGIMYWSFDRQYHGTGEVIQEEVKNSVNTTPTNTNPGGGSRTRGYTWTFASEHPSFSASPINRDHVRRYGPTSITKNDIKTQLVHTGQPQEYGGSAWDPWEDTCPWRPMPEDEYTTVPQFVIHQGYTQTQRSTSSIVTTVSLSGGTEYSLSMTPSIANSADDTTFVDSSRTWSPSPNNLVDFEVDTSPHYAVSYACGQTYATFTPSGQTRYSKRSGLLEPLAVAMGLVTHSEYLSNSSTDQTGTSASEGFNGSASTIPIFVSFCNSKGDYAHCTGVYRPGLFRQTLTYIGNGYETTTDLESISTGSFTARGFSGNMEQNNTLWGDDPLGITASIKRIMVVHEQYMRAYGYDYFLCVGNFTTGFITLQPGGPQ